MEVTARRITLLMTVVLQLAAHKADAAFWIHPTRLQLFEYQPVSFECTGFDGSTGWRILRRIKTEISACGLLKWGMPNESSCTIKNAYPEDSGEYWCETGEGLRSNSVNVIITAGSVILESPVLPVMEGDDVTLSCRNKTTSSMLLADFHKDGRLIWSSSTEHMTIHNVSKADEGLYKCDIFGVGESPESRLTVSVMTVVLQLAAHKADAAFGIHPTKLQLFEYQPVSFECTGFDGSTGWRILRRTKTEISACGLLKWGMPHESSCTIKHTYPEDSGEYWCETGEGLRSNSVNVIITAGSVILESPVLPVMEGDDVTLSCRNKTTSSVLQADFYKDGRLIWSSLTEHMTIHNVSKADEGLYKCDIFGVGESPESRLTVSELPPTSSDPSSSSSTPWIIVSVSLMLLLLAVGLLHLGKGYWHRVLSYLSTQTPGSGSAGDQTDEDELPSRPDYYTLDLDLSPQLDEEEQSSRSDYYTLDLDVTQHLGSEGTPRFLTTNAVYSTIQKVAV